MIKKIKNKISSTLNGLESFQQSEAKKLNRRIKVFLTFYIPTVILLIGWFCLNGDVVASSIYDSSTNESTEENSNSTYNSNSRTTGRLEQWIENSQGDEIYTYSAGEDSTYSLYTPGFLNDTDFYKQINTGGVPTKNWLENLNDWLWNSSFSMVTGQVGENQNANGLEKLLYNILAFIYSIFVKSFGNMVRLMIGLPFLFIEVLLSAFGPNAWPGSVFGLFLGRVGSGGSVTTNLFGFELVDGNIYGIAGSLFYTILATVAGYGLVIRAAGSIAGAAWSSGSGESRQKLKNSILYCAGGFLLIVLLPYLVYIVEYARDILLYYCLKICENISSINLNLLEGGHGSYLVGGSLDGIASDFMSAAIICGRSVIGSNVGSSYNPLLARAFDFTSGTILDTLLYDGSVILLVIFMFIYISLAFDTMFTFATFPISYIRGKQALNEWIEHMIANLLTPVMDIMIMMVPLMLGSMSMTSVSNYLLVNLLQIVLCFTYFSMRSSMRARLGLRSAQSSEGAGIGGMMMAMGAFRMLGNGVNGLVSTVSGLASGSSSDFAAADMMDAQQAGLNNELNGMQNTLSSVDDMLDNKDGVMPGSLNNSDDGGLNATDADSELADINDSLNGTENSLSGMYPGTESGEEDDLQQETELSDAENALNAIENEMPENEDGLQEMVQDGQNPMEEDGLSDDDIEVREHINETSADGEKILDNKDGSSGNDISQETGMNVKPGSEQSYADRLEQTGIRAGKMYNELGERQRAEMEAARVCDEKASHLQTMIAKDSAGTMTAKEKEGYLGRKESQALVAQYREASTKHRNAAMQYRDEQQKVATINSTIRSRMGLSGRGPLTAADIQSVRTIRANATLGNFDTNTLISRALTPEQQAKFYRERAGKRQAGIAASVVTTTTIGGLTGAGGMFMPTAAKLGTVAAVGNIGRLVGEQVATVGTNRAILDVDVNMDSIPNMDASPYDVPVVDMNGEASQMRATGTLDVYVNAMRDFQIKSMDPGPSGISHSYTDSQQFVAPMLRVLQDSGTDWTALESYGITPKVIAQIREDSQLAQDICTYADNMRVCAETTKGDFNPLSANVQQAIYQVMQEESYKGRDIVRDGKLAEMNQRDMVNRQNLITDLYIRLQKSYVDGPLSMRTNTDGTMSERFDGAEQQLLSTLFLMEQEKNGKNDSRYQKWAERHIDK